MVSGQDKGKQGKLAEPKPDDQVLSCRWACSIQLEESVIITGASDSDYCEGGQYSGSEKRVEQYNLGGSMGRLPDMKTGRSYHACGKYLQDGKVVST